MYVALYERGPAWIEGKSAQELPKFAEHVAHIRALEPRLLGAGPFKGTPGESFVGMLVFIASSDDEARNVAESDPFVVGKYTRVRGVLRWQVQGLKGWRSALGIQHSILPRNGRGCRGLRVVPRSWVHAVIFNGA